mmetsp:Transcript_7180/g.18113  ORF Transcript_7180/g.18113 Transcript_7180/m.18113 type:complete len:214 (+) Transcript_7180:64-705(+)
MRVPSIMAPGGRDRPFTPAMVAIAPPTQQRQKTVSTTLLPHQSRQRPASVHIAVLPTNSRPSVDRSSAHLPHLSEYGMGLVSSVTFVFPGQMWIPKMKFDVQLVYEWSCLRGQIREEPPLHAGATGAFVHIVHQHHKVVLMHMSMQKCDQIRVVAAANFQEHLHECHICLVSFRNPHACQVRFEQIDQIKVEEGAVPVHQKLGTTVKTVRSCN